MMSTLVSSMPPTMTEVPTRTCPHCGFEESSDASGARGAGSPSSSVPPACAGAGARRSCGAASPSASSRWRSSPSSSTRSSPIATTASARRRRRPSPRAHPARAPAGPPPRLRHAARAAAGASDLDRLDAAGRPRARRRGLDHQRRAGPRSPRRAQGPISHTECGPLLKAKAAVPDDRVLSKSIGRYDCVAVKTSVTGEGGQSVGRLGFPFVAALDFKKFTYVWCRNTPGQGERGVALAFVRLARACLAAKGRALGTGYVDVPGS